MPTTSPRRSLAPGLRRPHRARAALALLVALASTALFLAPALADDLSFPHPFAQVAEGADHAQDAMDIQATAEAVYGHALTATQLAKTKSWNTHNLGWWRDARRESAALDLLAGLYEAGSWAANADQMASELRASDDFFGIEVTPVPNSTWGDSAEPEYLQYTISYRKRPDLASYDAALLGFADQYQTADDEERKLLFQSVFGDTGLPQDGAGAEAFDRDDLAVLIDAFLRDFESKLESRRQSQVDSLFYYHANTLGGFLDQTAFEALETAGFRARSHSLEAAATAFFASLSALDDPNLDDLGAEMVEGLIENWLAGADMVLQHPTSSKRAELAGALADALSGSTTE